MIEELQHTVETLLLETEPAADSARNGLLDRGDLQEAIARPRASVGQLTATCEGLRRERDVLLERLSRSSHPAN